MTMSLPLEESKNPSEIEAMFTRIAPRYDITNRITSFGFDMAWRKLGIKMASPSNDATVLDLGCGTGDMMKLVLMRNRFRGKVVGVDLSQAMIELAENKLGKIQSSGSYELRRADALQLRDPAASYDLIMTCFGVRNFEDLARGFSEVARLLKPGGRFLVIEFFSLDREPWIMRFYLDYILPVLGGILSGGKFAYNYLNRSKKKYLSADEFCKIAENYSLKLSKRRILTMGVAEILLFEKNENV